MSKTHAYHGEQLTVAAIAEREGVSSEAVRARITRNGSPRVEWPDPSVRGCKRCGSPEHRSPKCSATIVLLDGAGI